MEVITFAGDQAAFFNNGSDPGTASEFSGIDNPFLPTDIVEVEISDTSIYANGELDSSQIDLLGITVIRDGVSYDFFVDSGYTIKDSGGGSAPAQGYSFITTAE
ncbi:MAG: hypothetical protein AB3N24_18290, partial [Leisingera sp.]